MRITLPPGVTPFRDRGYTLVRASDIAPFAGVGTISIFAINVGANQRLYVETCMLRVSLLDTIPVGGRIETGIWSRDQFNTWDPILFVELQNGEGPGLWGPYVAGPFTLDTNYDLRSQVMIAGVAFSGEVEASYHGFTYDIV